MTRDDRRGLAFVERTLLLIACCVAMTTACSPKPASVSIAQCPAFRNIDLRALPTHLNNDPREPLLEDLLTTWNKGQASVPWRTSFPTATFHFRTYPGLSSDPTAREVLGRRSGKGWEVYARSQTGPDRPLTAWTPVRMSGEAEQKLAAILKDPCLWAAPRFIGDQVRLLNGRYDWRPDGPSTTYEVTYNGRRWSGWQFSWSLGPPGELRRLLLAESFGLPQHSLDEIDAHGWLDQPQ